MAPELLENAIATAVARLREARRPYAIATVVRTVGATAAKPGARALILADGTIAEGWVGGGCVRGAMTRAAVAAIGDGTPRLISLRPEDEPGAPEEHQGIEFARNGCPSKGSMDLFIEPVLPQPELVIIGASPVARSLAALAGSFSFDIIPHDSATALGPLPAGARRMVVVATQGKGDLDGLKTALGCGADYIGFVASHRKFTTLAETLREAGADEAELARINAPAGLAIDAVTPDEIALSILAQVIKIRRSGQRRPETETA